MDVTAIFFYCLLNLTSTQIVALNLSHLLILCYATSEKLLFLVTYLCNGSEKAMWAVDKASLDKGCALSLFIFLLHYPQLH